MQMKNNKITKSHQNHLSQRSAKKFSNTAYFIASTPSYEHRPYFERKKQCIHVYIISHMPRSFAHQWSFRTTGTLGTLASQAEIGVPIQTPGRFCRVPEYYLRKSFEIVYAKSYNLEHFGSENGSQCRAQCVVNSLTLKTAFPRSHPRNDSVAHYFQTD